MYQVSL